MLGILNIWTKRRDTVGTHMLGEKEKGVPVATTSESNVGTPFAGNGGGDTPLPLSSLSTTQFADLGSSTSIVANAQGSPDVVSEPIGVAPASSASSGKLRKKVSLKRRSAHSTSTSGVTKSTDVKKGDGERNVDVGVVEIRTTPIPPSSVDIGQTPVRVPGRNSTRSRTKRKRISLRSLAFVYPNRHRSTLSNHQRESSLRQKAAEAGKRETLLPQERISLRNSPHPLMKNAPKALTRSERRAQKSAVVLQRVIMGTTADEPEVSNVHAAGATVRKYRFGLKVRKATANSTSVSKVQLEKVKKELMQPKRANEVIAHLRTLPVPTATVSPSSTEGTPFTTASVDKSRPCGPIHAVCLAHTEEEVDASHSRKVQATKADDEPESEVQPAKNTSFASASLESVMPLFEDLGIHVVDLVSSPDLGLGQPGDGKGLFAGAVPTAGTVMNGVMQITPQLMALGFATGKAIIPNHKGVYPPLDRMSVITYWWGLEITMPPPTIKYLANAKSISHAVVNFLTALSVMYNGVREILPFIRYISQFIDFEWNAIRAQDRGKGVVCAATWLMPAAMVPRPWDFPDPPPGMKREQGENEDVREGDDVDEGGNEDAGEDRDRESPDLLDIISPPPGPPIVPKLKVTAPTLRKRSIGEEMADVDTGTDVPKDSLGVVQEVEEGRRGVGATATKDSGDADVGVLGKGSGDGQPVLTSSVTAPMNEVPP